MSTTDTRAAFEAWVKREYPNFLLDYAPLMGFYKGDDGERIGDMYDAWQAATEAAKAKQSTPTAPTLAQQIEEINYKRAFMEWSEKTDWVQEQISTFPINAIGKHRADIMREEIERLRAEAAKATGTAGELDRYTLRRPSQTEAWMEKSKTGEFVLLADLGCGACGDACNGGKCRLAAESPPSEAARQPAPVLGLKMICDPNMPSDQVEFRMNGETVGRIVNIAATKIQPELVSLSDQQIWDLLVDEVGVEHINGTGEHAQYGAVLWTPAQAAEVFRAILAATTTCRN